MKLLPNRKNIALYVLILFGILQFGIGILNHYFFKTYTYDYGNYNFAFWDYAHFRISNIPLLSSNFLQDHFSLTLMYFIPVYWLFNWLTETYTLILIQSSLVVIAAWYSYKIIVLKTQNIWMGTGVLIFYFVLLGRYTSFTGDVNLAIISACFIPIFLYYFETEKYNTSMVILLLSLFSRENIPLWFIFIFVVLIIEHRKNKKAVLYSVAGILASIIYFVLLFKVFIPAVESPTAKYSLFNYSALGANPGEAISHILKHPFDSVKMFFLNHLGDQAYDGIKAEFYIVYLVSGGLVMILRPQYFIWFIPIVAQKVLNDVPVRWSIASYYSIEVVTLLPISVFMAISSIKRPKIQIGLIAAVCVSALSMTIYKLDLNNCKAATMMNPRKEKFYDKRFYKIPFNLKEVNKLMSLVPADAKVSASNMFVPHFAQRRNIYYFPSVNDAEYLILSVFDHYYLQSLYENEIERMKYLQDPKWETVGFDFPVFLLKRNENPACDKSGLNMIWSHTDTLHFKTSPTDSTNWQLTFINTRSTVKPDCENQYCDLSKSIVIEPQGYYDLPVNIDTINTINHIRLSVWCKDENKSAFIVATACPGFYVANNESDLTNQLGWRRLILSFWLPDNIDVKSFKITLHNSGKAPIYFNNLQIIRNFRKVEDDILTP